MYTLLELESKTFGELKQIADELSVLPEGDRRCRQTWIDAIVGVNSPLLQVLEVSPAEEVQAQEQQVLEISPAEEVQEPMIETVEIFPAENQQSQEWVDTEPPNREDYEFREEYDEALKEWRTATNQEAPLESKFGRIVYPKPAEEPIAQAAKTSPAVEVDPVQEAPLESKFCHIVYPKPAPKPIAQAAENPPGVESDQNPILTNADAWNPAEFREVIYAVEPSGQLNLLEWDVSEPPEPDDYKGDMFAFQAAYDHWLSTSELHEIIHTQNSPGITQAPEPIAQNASTRLEFPRNESAGLRFVGFHPAQPDGNYICTETAGLGNQEGDRVLEVERNSKGHQGRNVPHQPTQLSQSNDSRIKLQSSYLELEIGMLVGRRRDRQHLGKILAIYKSRRGIWRAKIKPLNKSNFVYFDCAALIEQRLLYDYEMKPGGFVLTGEIFNKARCEHFEVLSRKVRSPKPTNWTAGELSSLSTFKLKQIARDMEIPSIPGTAGKRSLIRAILAEQTISQEKAAAQRERETGRAIVQKQKSVPTTGKKKRAAASPLGNQLSLFDVAV